MFIFISWIQEVILTLFVVQLFYSMRQCNFRNESLLLQGVVPKNKFAQRKQKNPAAKISRTTPLLRTNAALVIYIYIYIYTAEGINNYMFARLRRSEHFAKHHP